MCFVLFLAYEQFRKRLFSEHNIGSLWTSSMQAVSSPPDKSTVSHEFDGIGEMGGSTVMCIEDGKNGA